MAGALEKDDVDGARAIIEAAVILPRVDALEKDRLLGAIKKALGAGFKKSSLEDIWSHAAERLRPSPEAMAAAESAAKGADKAAERARLWPIVEELANRPDLLDHAASVAQALGVVGERKAIKANYIAMSSRTLGEQRVLSVVITGLSSAGKSHLMNTVARIFPPEFIEVITSGSPKSLVFMVRDDPHALSHKIILLGETAGYIAGSDADSNPSAALVRDVLTEGVITYGISEKDDKGQFVTHRIKVWGPISLITTTARANLDPEMENRLLGVPIDESPRATAAIRHAQLSGETRRRAEAAAPEVEKLIDFQRWLQLEEGVRVVIPDDLLELIDAVGGIPVTVQTRRDVPLFLFAVKACAVIHIARRQRDAKGQVVAEFEDYEVAHDAVDGFVAAAYSASLKPPEIAVLAAIEALIVEARKRRKAEADKAAAAGKPEIRRVRRFFGYRYESSVHLRHAWRTGADQIAQHIEQADQGAQARRGDQSHHRAFGLWAESLNLGAADPCGAGGYGGEIRTLHARPGERIGAAPRSRHSPEAVGSDPGRKRNAPRLAARRRRERRRPEQQPGRRRRG